MSSAGNTKQLLIKIQIFCIAGQSAQIKLGFPNEPAGEIFIEKGEIAHAVWGDLSGEEAFLSLLQSKNGVYSEDFKQTSAKRTIYQSSSKLLLKASRLIGENALQQEASQVVKTPTANSDRSESKSVFLKPAPALANQAIAANILLSQSVRNSAKNLTETKLTEAVSESFAKIPDSRSFIEMPGGSDDIVVTDKTLKPNSGALEASAPFQKQLAVTNKDDSEILNKSNEQSSSESLAIDRTRLQITEPACSDHDLLLREIVATGVVQHGVVIDEDGSIICEIGDNSQTISRLAFLVKGLESAVMPNFDLGDFIGAVVEVPDQTLMVSRSQNFSCAFLRPHRMPVVRAFEEVQKAFKRAFVK